MNGQLLKAGEVAERWKATPAQVYRLAREGQLPCVRLGANTVRFRLDAIEEFERKGGAS